MVKQRRRITRRDAARFVIDDLPGPLSRLNQAVDLPGNDGLFGSKADDSGHGSRKSISRNHRCAPASSLHKSDSTKAWTLRTTASAEMFRASLGGRPRRAAFTMPAISAASGRSESSTALLRNVQGSRSITLWTSVPNTVGSSRSRSSSSSSGSTKTGQRDADPCNSASACSMAETLNWGVAVRMAGERPHQRGE